MDIGTIVILAVIALLTIAAVWYLVRRDHASRTADEHRSPEHEAEYEREAAKAIAQGTGGVPRRGGGPMGV